MSIKHDISRCAKILSSGMDFNLIQNDLCEIDKKCEYFKSYIYIYKIKYLRRCSITFEIWDLNPFCLYSPDLYAIWFQLGVVYLSHKRTHPSREIISLGWFGMMYGVGNRQLHFSYLFLSDVAQLLSLMKVDRNYPLFWELQGNVWWYHCLLAFSGCLCIWRLLPRKRVSFLLLSTVSHCACVLMQFKTSVPLNESCYFFLWIIVQDLFFISYFIGEFRLFLGFFFTQYFRYKLYLENRYIFGDIVWHDKILRWYARSYMYRIPRNWNKDHINLLLFVYFMSEYDYLKKEEVKSMCFCNF